MVDTLTSTVESVKVDKVTVLGTGNGGAGNGAGTLAPKLIGTNEQLKAALGVDLLGALQARIDQPQAQPRRPQQPQRQPQPQQPGTARGEISVETAPPPQRPPRPPAR